MPRSYRFRHPGYGSATRMREIERPFDVLGANGLVPRPTWPASKAAMLIGFFQMLQGDARLKIWSPPTPGGFR